MISAIIHNLPSTDAPADWPKCPGCGRPLRSFQQRDLSNERFKLNMREIFGYCCKCGSVHIELAQKDNAWQITRYRFFVLKPLAWSQVNELPVPIILTGS